MAASRLLVVRLPAKAAGWEDISAIHEYVSRALVDGVMVLGEGIKLELVELPPLGAVEVVGEPVLSVPAELSVSSPRKPRKAKRVPESGTPKKEQPLQMAEADIVASYRQAANPSGQIGILADLNLCSKERILDILRGSGVELPAKKNGPDGRGKERVANDAETVCETPDELRMQPE